MANRSASAASAPEHRPTMLDKTTLTSQQRNRGSGRRSGRTSVRRRRLASLFLCGASAFVLVGSTGCTMLSGVSKFWQHSEFCDEFIISHRNQALGLKAWYREKKCHHNEPYLKEFKQGFLQGYADVANGSDGCVPAVAPSQYWGWRYQSADGQAAINAWFAGYPLGVKAAEQDGVGNWSQVRPMGMRQPTPANLNPAAMDPAAVNPANMPPVGIPLGTPYVIGPDGKPVAAETVVPGEAIPMEAFEEDLDPMELGSPGDFNVPLEPGANLPSANDEAFNASPPDVLEFGGPDEGRVVPVSDSMEIPSTFDSPQGSTSRVEDDLAAAQSAAEPQGAVASLSDAENLVPKQSSSPSYSINDLGEEAIEGIFGSMEESSNVAVLSPESTASQGAVITDAQDSAPVEAASADGEIPFKFE